MYTVELVKNGIQEEEFLMLPLKIYNNDPNWIRPLDQDIKNVFNPSINKFYRNGSCERILVKKNNDTIGRCAVFCMPKYKAEQPTGGIGFFECINDQDAANIIFDYCKNWLLEQGMEAMDGPINFGERDKWWGLLIEGFQPPLYNMNYNPPYYKALFENYGFQIYYNQECFGRPVNDEFSKKILENYNIWKNDPNIQVKHFENKNATQFIKDFTTVYNKAWKSHGGGKTLTESQTAQMFKSMKPIMDKNICFILYYDNEPIGGWLNLPDLNYYMQSFDGQFGWWQKLQLFIKMQLKTNQKMVGIVFGVIPEWQGKGVDSYMIKAGSEHIFKATKYTTLEMQWIGDFNPKMINVAKGLGAILTRRLATYRILFNNKQFTKHPII